MVCFRTIRWIGAFNMKYGIFIGMILISSLLLPLPGIRGDESFLNTGHSQENVRVDLTLAPHPTLAPDDVVRIQLEALQHNGRRNRGIELTFRFASPANRSNTGPIERFQAIIKSPLYRPMLNSLSVEYEPVEIRGEVARQRVSLIGKSGKKFIYVFYLSKQFDEPYSNCWMTDAVIVERVEDRSISI